ncbi:hypothetical protein [Microcoleus sp. PH2017_27_LUM_O_A]|nr:hypothetical protein [Microcoleus sp. PH2017_27_LUM_O_A]
MTPYAVNFDDGKDSERPSTQAQTASAGRKKEDVGDRGRRIK